MVDYFLNMFGLCLRVVCLRRSNCFIIVKAALKARYIISKAFSLSWGKMRERCRAINGETSHKKKTLSISPKYTSHTPGKSYTRGRIRWLENSFGDQQEDSLVI